MQYELIRSGKNKYVNCDDAQNLTFGNHMHSSFEFIFVEDGELVCTIAEKAYFLHKNEAILIFPNRIHKFDTPVFSKNKTLIFSTDFVPAFYREIKNKEFNEPVFVFDAPQILENITKQDNFLKKSFLYYICGRAYEKCAPAELSGGSEMLIQKIALYLQDNFREDLQLDTLASEMNFNRCYLSDFINENFGMNFRTLLNGYRIDYARQLIEEYDDVTVTEISKLSGFATIRSFNRAFLKATGVSPREYKKHNG